MGFGRRKGILVVLALLAGLFIAWSASTWYRDRRLADGWSKIRTGMSKTEVELLLGSPQNVYFAHQVQSDSLIETLVENWLRDSFREKWAYGRRRKWGFQPQFPYLALTLEGFMGPEGDDYVIYFSAGGKVVKKTYPYRTR